MASRLVRLKAQMLLPRRAEDDERPERDAFRRPSRRGEQDVSVPPPELRIRLERGIPAEHLRATHVGGTVPRFVRMMNARARELGSELERFLVHPARDAPRARLPNALCVRQRALREPWTHWFSYGAGQSASRRLMIWCATALSRSTSAPAGQGRTPPRRRYRHVALPSVCLQRGCASSNRTCEKLVVVPHTTVTRLRIAHPRRALLRCGRAKPEEAQATGPR